MNCTRKECLEEYKEMVDNFDKDCIDHCSNPDCHNIYWNEDNGGVCEYCGKPLCGDCWGENQGDEEDAYCKECMKEGWKALKKRILQKKREAYRKILNSK